MFVQTLSQSAEPWKPVSGAKPPMPIISKSAVWRSERVRDSSAMVSLIGKSHQSGRVRGKCRDAAGLVDPALSLCDTRPATVARRAAGTDRLRAVRAADRGVAVVVKRVVRKVVLTDVVPDVALGPVGKRIQLPEVEFLVPAKL